MNPSVYLDTPVINFLYADDAPEKKEITIDFFQNFVKTGVYDTCVSEYVIAEINQTADENERNKLLNVLSEYFISVKSIADPNEIGTLAANYLEREIFPKKKLFDALHVAYCAVNKIDYLVSWNFKHLANVNRERRITALNYELGYFHPLRIITPIELTGYGN